MRKFPNFHRLHISYIFLGPTRWFMLMIPALLVISILSVIISQNLHLKHQFTEYIFRPDIVAQYLTGFVSSFIFVYALLLVIYFIRWCFIKYCFRNDQIQYVKGIFNKRSLSTAYPHIHSVLFKQRVLMRIFGLSDAFVRISGGKTNMSIKIPCMTKEEVNFFIRWIESYADVQDIPNLVPPSSFKLNFKEYLLCGFASRANYFACIAGYIMIVYHWYEGFKVFFLQLGDDGIQNIVNLTTKGHVTDILLGVAIVVPLFCGFVALVTYVFALVRYVGFEAQRKSDFVDVSYGLFNHYRHHVQVGRIQSLSIDHSLIGNLFKFCNVTVGIAETTKDVRSRSKLIILKKILRLRFSGRASFTLFPFCKNSNVSSLLSKLLPEYDHEPTQHFPVAKVATRRSVTRCGIFKGAGFWLAVVVLLIQFISLFIDPETFTSGYSSRVIEVATVVLILSKGSLYFYILVVIIALLQIISGIIWSRKSHLSFDDSCMEVVNGGFARKATRVFRRHVQYGYTQSSPFQRNSKVATIVWMTPAGVGGTLERLIDLPQEVGKSWLDWIA